MLKLLNEIKYTEMLRESGERCILLKATKIINTLIGHILSYRHLRKLLSLKPEWKIDRNNNPVGQGGNKYPKLYWIYTGVIKSE